MLKQERLDKITKRGNYLALQNKKLSIASVVLYKTEIIYAAFDGKETEHCKKAFEAIDEMKSLCILQQSKNEIEIHNLYLTSKKIDNQQCLNL